MEKEEWRYFVEGIYQNHIKPKLIKIRDRFTEKEFLDNRQLLCKASRSIRFIEKNFEEDDDLFKSFQPKFLENVLDNLDRGLRFSNISVKETEITDVIDQFFDEIVDGMEVSDIPEDDFRALFEAGSQNPRDEIVIAIDRIRKKKYYKKGTITKSLEEGEHIVIERKKALKLCNLNNPPKKKIFTGFLTICNGALLTSVDVFLMLEICLSLGWLPPVLLASTGTTPLGTLISSTVGVYQMLQAFGKLRGE